ncbi:MAG: hypothetical protein GOU98_04190 [Candidatus Altiarchaeota archaeon]|nr:hypothetical protein [Candidatus Altiarchaeota archaeon]
MDRFDTSVSLLISALVGAGVFGLPVLAKGVGLMSIFVIFFAFLYMLGLGYLIIEMFPGTVEEEVERYVGPWGVIVLILIEISIIFLALTSYAFAIKAHLGISDLAILTLLAIPLILELHLPANFTMFASFFTLAFVSLLSLLTIPRMELPLNIFAVTGSTMTDFANASTPPLMNLGSVVPLFLVALFAFYGHNMIPRIRNIMRSQSTTKKAFYMAISIVFLLYLPFAIAVSGTGVNGLATTYLSGIFGGPLASTIDLFSLLIFYMSFMVYGVHLVNDFGEKHKSVGIVVFGTAILYFLAQSLQVPFHMLIASAGLGVTIYGFLISLAGHNARKLKPIPTILLATTILTWIFLIIQIF